jgi:hypothetical protein
MGPSRAKLPNEVLDAAVELLGLGGGPRELPTREDTGSMMPTLQPGGEIRVDLSRARPRLGDITVFRQGPQLVVHRFLGRVPSPRVGWCLRCRGDYAPGFDPPVRPEDVRGRVVALEREGRWFSLDGGPARAYAVALALHDHFWGLVIGFVDRVARLGGAEERESPLTKALIRFDRASLRRVDALLFERVHRPAGEPGP